MNIYKKFISITIFFSTISIAQTVPLEPFGEWAKSRPNWSRDSSEVAYVASRCGALYSPIGSVFSENGRTNKDKESGEDLIGRGMQLSLFGLQMARDKGWSTEKIMERHKGIAEVYFKIIATNRTVHNNMFHGFIKDDFQFCTDFERIVRAVASTVK